MAGKAIDNYYNRFDPNKNYHEVLIRDGYGAQGSEINEIQSIFDYRITKLASSMFKDGDIISGGAIRIDLDNAKVYAEAGEVYVNGTIFDVPAAELDIATAGTVNLGVIISTKTISELEDSGLRNPAVGARGEGEPGAWRRQVIATWGLDSSATSDDKFCNVYEIIDGQQTPKEAPPQIDSFTTALAKYDRDSTGTGTYVVSGFELIQNADQVDGRQDYSLSEGRARVDGLGVEYPTSTRLLYNAEPDLRTIDTEVHTSVGETKQRIDVAHTPMKEVTGLRITMEVTATMTHGAYSGCSDDLPNTSVVSIQRVWQGDTTFVANNDYTRSGDKIDWSASGNEPSAGSTYQITYRYIASVTPEDVDLDGFSVTGAVQDTSILVTYTQMLPRYDRLGMDSAGALNWFQGISAEVNAQIPELPSNILGIATVYQTWRPDTRVVTNDGVRVMAFSEIRRLNDRIDYVMDQLAKTRLENDVATREAGTRVGLFVDPLNDDSMRDQGIEQTAAIVGGDLCLPIESATSLTFNNDIKAPEALPYTVTYDTTQLLQTTSMQVNPYMAYDILPAKVTLSPAVDRWTETNTVWASDVTQVFRATRDGGWARFYQTTTSTTTQTVSTSSTAIRYLRQIGVDFTITGFGPGERVSKVTFDGIDITYSVGNISANSSGVVRGRFIIPKNILAGSKNVTFAGVGGSYGSAVFFGQGTLTTTTLRRVVNVTNWYYDPIAQTFTPTENIQLAGVDLWFTAKSTEVRVQIREVENGVPSRIVLAEAILAPSQINTASNSYTRATFETPISLTADSEYAIVVLCNDAVTKLAIAETGKYDSIHSRWVTSQAYSIGVLLSSSNANSWTVHQDKDMAFRLLRANYSTLTKTVNLGQTQINGATDIILFSLADTPTSDTKVEYELTLPNGNIINVADGQSVQFDTPMTGNVSARVKMTGSRNASPTIHPDTQLLAGTVSTEADYCTRSITANNATKAVLIYDAYIPSGATVRAEYQTQAANNEWSDWQTFTSDGATPQGDNIVEYKFKNTISNVIRIRARISLTGTCLARPFVRDVRLMASI